MIPKELIADNMAYQHDVQGVFKKKLRKVEKWRTNTEVTGPLNYLQGVNSIWKVWRNTAGSSADPASVHWSLIRRSLWTGCCQEPIHKEGKPREKVGVCRVTQELDWKNIQWNIASHWLASPEPHPLNTLCTDIKCTACVGKTFDSQKLIGLAFVIPGR